MGLSEDSINHGRQARGLESLFESAELAQNTPQAPDIRFERVGSIRDDFWGHEVGSADNSPGTFYLSLQDSRNAEIADFDDPFSGQEDI